MNIKKTATEKRQDKLLKKYKVLQKHKKPKPKSNKFESIKYMKTLSYVHFLQTRYWKHVRSLILKRDGYKCVVCKCHDNIQVHHDTYKHHFDELNHLGDLMTLCKSCHKEHHNSQ